MSRYRFLIVVFLALSIYTCKDEEEIVSQTVSLSYTNHSSEENSFILITNQDGEVLTQKLGLGSTETIQYEKDTNDEVDFTFGRLLGPDAEGFNLTTYRNISKDFTYDVPPSCLELEIIPKTRKLSLQNLAGEILYSPFRDSNEIGNTIELSGITIKEKLVITIRDQVSGQIKSRLIRAEEWTQEENGEESLVLDAQDFEVARVHNIETNVSSNWGAVSSVIDNDGFQIELGNLFSPFQSGQHAAIYIPNDLEYQSTSLSLATTNFNNGYFYNSNTAVEFPTTIDFETNNYRLIKANQMAFEFGYNNPYHLGYIQYEYPLTSYLNAWRVYQRSTYSSEYTLPTLTEPILEFLGPNAELLKIPHQVQGRFYQLENFDEQVMFSDNVDRRLHCLDFTASFNTIGL